ncbi:hypothetical protein AAVH_05106 [Aphelenchoides avenae]|nr:hypothetical protein AAVH_05106 [Aphelenchus avenae]
MSTSSSENQPTTTTPSNQRQQPTPSAPDSAPPPSVVLYQAYASQAPYGQQQPPYAPPSYVASSIFWANCVYIGIALLVFVTIFAITFLDLSKESTLKVLYVFWLVLSAHIAVQITYIAALRKVSKVRLFAPTLEPNDPRPMLRNTEECQP